MLKERGSVEQPGQTEEQHREEQHSAPYTTWTVLQLPVIR